MNIIIVDDNKLEREGIFKMLQAMDIDINIEAVFENGEAAFTYLQNNDIDIVVSDIQMPFLSGIDFVKKLRSEKISTKVIFVSCYDDFTYARSAIDLEVISYVLKPVIKADLKAAVLKAYDLIKKEETAVLDVEYLKEQILKSRPMKREQFLRNMLFNYVPDNEVISENMELLDIFLDLPDEEAFFSVVTLKLGKISDQSKTKNELLFTSGIVRFTESLSSDEVKLFPVVMSNNMISVVLIMSEKATADIADVIIPIKNYIVEKLAIEVFFGISDICRDIKRLGQLYSQSISALGYTSSGPTNKMVFYSDVESEDSDEIDIRIVQSEVNSLILGGIPSDCKDFLDSYLKEDKLYSTGYLNDFAHAVVYSIQLTLLEYNKSLEVEVGTSLWAKLADFDSIANFEQWILNILYFSIEILSSKRDTSKEKIVEDIKNIIAAKFTSRLTASEIANELSYSSKYLNYTFRSFVGKSIFDYLTEYRMEKAKELLKEPDSKIYVVSEQVGYKRKTHFNDLFKQYTGLSPSEYKSMSN